MLKKMILEGIDPKNASHMYGLKSFLVAQWFSAKCLEGYAACATKVLLELAPEQQTAVYVTSDHKKVVIVLYWEDDKEGEKRKDLQTLKDEFCSTKDQGLAIKIKLEEVHLGTQCLVQQHKSYRIDVSESEKASTAKASAAKASVQQETNRLPDELQTRPYTRARKKLML